MITCTLVDRIWFLGLFATLIVVGIFAAVNLLRSL
jgi:hypothetical protein